MNHRFRITKAGEFKRVRLFGISYSHPLIVLIVCPNQLAYSRFAISAGRSVGKATRRNRIKRLFRSAISAIQDSIKPGWDILLLARKSSVGAEYQDIMTGLTSTLKQADLILFEDG